MQINSNLLVLAGLALVISAPVDQVEAAPGGNKQARVNAAKRLIKGVQGSSNKWCNSYLKGAKPARPTVVETRTKTNFVLPPAVTQVKNVVVSKQPTATVTATNYFGVTKTVTQWSTLETTVATVFATQTEQRDVTATETTSSTATESATSTVTLPNADDVQVFITNTVQAQATATVTVDAEGNVVAPTPAPESPLVDRRAPPIQRLPAVVASLIPSWLRDFSDVAQEACLELVYGTAEYPAMTQVNTLTVDVPRGKAQTKFLTALSTKFVGPTRTRTMIVNLPTEVVRTRSRTRTASVTATLPTTTTQDRLVATFTTTDLATVTVPGPVVSVTATPKTVTAETDTTVTQTSTVTLPPAAPSPAPETQPEEPPVDGGSDEQPEQPEEPEQPEVEEP